MKLVFLGALFLSRSWQRQGASSSFVVYKCKKRMRKSLLEVAFVVVVRSFGAAVAARVAVAAAAKTSCSSTTSTTIAMEPRLERQDNFEGFHEVLCLLQQQQPRQCAIGGCCYRQLGIEGFEAGNRIGSILTSATERKWHIIPLSCFLH